MTTRCLSLRAPEAAALARDGRVEIVRPVKPGGVNAPTFVPNFVCVRGSGTAVWSNGAERPSPFGPIGTRLRVREPWWIVEREGCGVGNRFLLFDEEWIAVPGEGTVPDESAPLRPVRGQNPWGKHSAATMPAWASRMAAEVVAVAIERNGDAWQWRAELRRVEL